jgi:Ca2+-binding RTX toxin-like protein
MGTGRRGAAAAVVAALVTALLFVGSDPASAASTTGTDQTGGYIYRDSRAPGGPTFHIRSAPTTLPFATFDDDTEVNVTLPFPFDFYGVARTETTVSPNGAVVFPGSQQVSASNSTLSGNVQDMIAPLWDDWQVFGRVGTGLAGSAPNRVFTVYWHDMRSPNPFSSSVDFQLQLFEHGDAIEFHYIDAATGDSHSQGASATIGIDHGTTSALQYSFNSASLANGRAIRFNPVFCDGLVPTITGTFGPDIIVGLAGNDVIMALTGADVVNSGGGNDRVCLGSGNDTADLGTGNDRGFGEAGDDTLRGRGGLDRLDGGPNADTLRGGTGVDVCLGRGGIDVAFDCETVTGVP